MKGLVCIGGQCVAAACSAGAVKCDGGKVLTCNAGATGWATSADCAADGQVCLLGKCQVCFPGETKCAGSNIAACNADGAAWVEASCDDGNVCTADACKDGACGSVPSGDGGECAAGKACKAGVCVSKVPDGMVVVPAGKFWMGCSADEPCSSSAKPRHQVFLDAFAIDVHEVTVARYKSCVAAKGCTVPAYTKAPCTWLAGNEQLPIACINWFQANDYCAWAGGRLPTSAEWEKAALGGLEPGPFPWYPWGAAAGACAHGVWNDGNATTGQGCDGEGPLPAGSKPLGKNGFGLFDMGGNTEEWCSDWYSLDYYLSSPASNPQGPASGTYRIQRGGSWASVTPESLAVTSASGSVPSGAGGVRCVISSP